VRLCYCAFVVPLRTRTRVVLLQHPREEGLAIGTAHMAQLCLPDAELHVGVHFSSERLASILDDRERPAALLWPGEGAIDLATDPPAGPITLVVIDGTWPQAKSLVRKNPALATLPRYAFAAPSPSNYRIRREPRAEYLSTIESLAHVLGLLEGDAARFEKMHAPFTAMVDNQLAFVASVATPRRRVRRLVRTPTPPAPPAIYRERLADLVCMVAESNAWPLSSGRDRTDHPGELLHLVALRMPVGDREPDVLDVVCAPEGELAPGTPSQIELSDATLRSGVGLPHVRASLAAFLRPSDVLVTWGTHTRRVLEAASLPLPSEHLDLRRQARVFASERVGPIETFLARLGGPAPTIAQGRAGARVATMQAIVQHFAARAR
jgi:DTW domain-containing protein YfiP